jgi:hypothetical protein
MILTIVFVYLSEESDVSDEEFEEDDGSMMSSLDFEEDDDWEAGAEEAAKESEEPLGCNDSLKSECIKWWNHYKPRLLPDIVRVAYLLSPNPKIMEHALANRDAEDYHAA